MNAIDVHEFRKRYRETEAVRGINLAVTRGELFGMIGPDGAGKTTLLRAICTLLLPDEGRILVQGLDTTRDIERIRSIIGYMPQRFSLYQDLTVEQNLHFFADLFQVPRGKREARLEQLYRFSKLAPFKKRTAGALSGGMKQKLALSCALIHTPDILVLDEPTYGVDPLSRKEFWDILRSIQESGTTILVATAYMDEADQCDRVALFYQGRIEAVDTPEELKRGYRFPLFRIEGNDLRQLNAFFRGLPEVHSTQLFGDSLHVSFKNLPQLQAWRKWQEMTHRNLLKWERYPPTTEDVFLQLMEPAQ